MAYRYLDEIKKKCHSPDQETRKELANRNKCPASIYFGTKHSDDGFDQVFSYTNYLPLGLSENNWQSRLDTNSKPNKFQYQLDQIQNTSINNYFKIPFEKKLASHKNSDAVQLSLALGELNELKELTESFSSIEESEESKKSAQEKDSVSEAAEKKYGKTRELLKSFGLSTDLEITNSLKDLFEDEDEKAFGGDKDDFYENFESGLSHFLGAGNFDLDDIEKKIKKNKKISDSEKEHYDKIKSIQKKHLESLVQTCTKLNCFKNNDFFKEETKQLEQSLKTFEKSISDATDIDDFCTKKATPDSCGCQKRLDQKLANLSPEKMKDTHYLSNIDTFTNKLRTCTAKENATQ